jgi:hypothetical protein
VRVRFAPPIAALSLAPPQAPSESPPFPRHAMEAHWKRSLHANSKMGIPDWMNINQEDLDLALKILPIPLKGPIPPGISFQEAIQEFQVNQRHNIHIRHHKNIILHSNLYTISYAYIVHYIGITLLILYTISDTISCTMFDVSI